MTDRKAVYVRRLFSKVPVEYNRLLRILSFSQDKYWRTRLVEQVVGSDGIVLDVATGTGLVAAELIKAIGIPPGYVVGVDLTRSMLDTAKAEFSARKTRDGIDWVLARAENLPFKDGCFDASTISLALRNVSDAQQTLKEMARVTVSGGSVASLDFARPPHLVQKLFYYPYLLGLFPIIGQLVSEGWAETLSYLGRSILRSRTGNQVASLMIHGGVEDAKSIPLTGGIVCLVYGKKR